MVDSFLVVLVLSLDAFTASVAYGADRIRISPRSALVISGMGTLFLMVSVVAGGLLGNLIPPAFCTAVSVSILFIVGLSLIHIYRRLLFFPYIADGSPPDHARQSVSALT